MSRRAKIRVGFVVLVLAIGAGREAVLRLQGITPLPLSDLEAGHCLQMPDAERFDEVHVLDCVDEHDSQVYAINTVDGRDPDEDRLITACQELWFRMGPPTSLPTSAEVHVLYEEHSLSGSINVACAVRIPGGMSGTVVQATSP